MGRGGIDDQLGTPSFASTWVRASIAAMVALVATFALFMAVATSLRWGVQGLDSVRAIRDSVGFIVLGGVVAGLASALASQAMSRRVSREIAAFSDAISKAAAGDLRALAQRYEVEDLNPLAEQVDELGARIESMLENERRLSREVSHQLRTPLTALGLRLEEISHLEDLDAIRAEASMAQTQVERLGGVIDQLLAISRGESPSIQEVWLGDVVEAQVQEWRPAFAAEGRDLAWSGQLTRRARANPAAAEQVLATLLDNSLVHGTGATSITLRQDGHWVAYDVMDSGGRIQADESVDIFARGASASSTSGGLGLALARRLVEADGGRLELVRRDPVTFRVFLRSAREPDMSPAGARPDAPGESSTVKFLGLDDGEPGGEARLAEESGRN